MSQSLPLPTDGTTQSIYPGGYADATTIKNTGTENAFIDADNQPVNGGYQLSPGSTVVWDEGRPLYAACVAGFPTTLTLTPNGGNIFDASAVAAAIIDQGLAVAIADAIQLRGAPPFDPMTLIQSNNFSPMLAVAQTGPMLDVSGYQSLNVQMVDDEQLATGVPFTVPLPRIVSLFWYRDINGFSGPVAVDQCLIDGTNTQPGNAGFQTVVVTPVKAPFVQVTVQPTARVNGRTIVNIIGSYKTALKTSYQHTSVYYATNFPANFIQEGVGYDGLAGARATAPIVAGAYDCYLPTIDGPCRFSLVAPTIGTATSVVGQIIDASTGHIFARLTTTVSSTLFSDQLVLPERPVFLRLSVLGGTVTTLQSSLQMDP